MKTSRVLKNKPAFIRETRNSIPSTLMVVALLVPQLSILYTIGGILVVIGVILWVLGAVGRPVGGRKVWF